MNPDPTELLHTLVSTPSLSRDEARIARVLRGYLGDHGVTARVDDDHNVIVELRGDAPGPTILLNSHLDTVPPADGWESDPWTPTVHDGRLVGLGSGDAKASVTAMACATIRAAGEGISAGRLVFAATVMEEVGHGGLEHLAPTLGDIDGALVGEPTTLEPALAQGGLLLLTGRAHGTSSHAARAHLGVNALTIAARDLIALDSLSLDRVHPLLGGSTLNVTVIQGGERHNTIPDLCTYTLDIRYTPSYHWEEIRDLVDAHTEAEIVLRSSRLQPVETPESSPLVQALLKAHPEATPFGSPTMSDWVHLRGIHAIKIGPGDSERSHTAGESVELSQVARAADIYHDTLQGFLASPS